MQTYIVMDFAEILLCKLAILSLPDILDKLGVIIMIL